MDVVTIGETMVLMAPGQVGSLEGVHEFHKKIAGAETNVAIGLARLGHRVAWLSKLGNDSFGRFVYKTVRGEGVDVSCVKYDSHHPTGVMFKETMAGGAVQVYYYRKNSAASHLQPEDVPGTLLQGAKFLHVSGITPALSESARATIFHVVSLAKQQGVQVVFDPNVRRKLWTLEEAVPVLKKIAGMADIVLPGVEEGNWLTGLDKEADITEAFHQMGAHTVVVKLGPQGAYYSSIREGQKSSGYAHGYVVQAVDEVGAGDAFAAGVLSGLIDGLSVADATQRACALGALAVTNFGDYEALPTRDELERFLGGQSQVMR